MTELSKTKAQFYASLQQPKIRQREGLFIVEGHKGVSDTLSAFQLEALIGTETRLKDFNVPNRFIATPAVLEKISGLKTAPDILAVYRRPMVPELRFPLEKKLYLMLDGVRDPGNMGTIIRTCDWFGIYDIIASKDCADAFNPKCIQATMGSIGRVKVHYVDLQDVIGKSPDLPVYGTLLSGEDIYQASLSTYGFLVMGNEGKGISKNIIPLITRGLKIPCYATKAEHSESLNVAVATGIVLSIFRSMR